MRIADSTLLIPLLDGLESIILTNEPLTRLDNVCGRIDLLLESITKQKESLIIPTPVLAEVLVRTEDATAAYIDLLSRSPCIVIATFDKRAALELVAMSNTVLAGSDKKNGVNDPYQKVKVDRQIIAIARVVGATTIYSSDAGMKKCAELCGLQVVSLEDLPVRETSSQGELDIVVEDSAVPL